MIKKLIRLFILVGFGYLMILALMAGLENQLVYRATPATERWQEPPSQIQDIWLDKNQEIHGWWLPSDSKSALLICHGNAGNVSDRAQTMLRFQQWLQCAVLIFDYPGYGKSPGKPSEAGCVHASKFAVDWLQQQGYPSDNIIVYGESLGGGVAMHLAEQFQFRAVTLVKTFTTLPDVAKRKYPWLPVQWLMRNRYDNLGKIRNLKYTPIFIAGATNDSLIPFAHSEKLFESANNPKQFFRLEGQDHADRLNDEYFAEFRDFLAKNPAITD